MGLAGCCTFMQDIYIHFTQNTSRAAQPWSRQMELKLFLTTFGIIFLAELGDKTQIASIMMAAHSQKPWTVFVGASLALVTITLLGVLFAGFISNYIPGPAIKKIAAGGFMVIGGLMLFDKI